MTLDEAHELMTVREVQTFLRIGRNAAYGLVASGQLPAVNLGKRQLRIPRHAVAELVGISASESTPEESVLSAA